MLFIASWIKIASLCRWTNPDLGKHSARCSFLRVDGAHFLPTPLGFDVSYRTRSLIRLPSCCYGYFSNIYIVRVRHDALLHSARLPRTGAVSRVKEPRGAGADRAGQGAQLVGPARGPREHLDSLAGVGAPLVHKCRSGTRVANLGRKRSPLGRRACDEALVLVDRQLAHVVVGADIRAKVVRSLLAGHLHKPTAGGIGGPLVAHSHATVEPQAWWREQQICHNAERFHLRPGNREVSATLKVRTQDRVQS